MTGSVSSGEIRGADAGRAETARILIVDHDVELGSRIGAYLRQHGMSVMVVSRTADMEACLALHGPFDLALIEVMMPDEDGISLLRRLDPAGRPPVMFLSATASLSHRIVGLEAGGEDYVEKPCSPRELLARIRAILSRCMKREVHADRQRFGDWTLDHGRKSLCRQLILATTLTEPEHRVLRALLDKPRRVCTRSELAYVLRLSPGDDPGRNVDMLVSRLRRKLGRNAPIRAVWNEGYMLAADVEPL